MKADSVKANGIHYTPTELADFLARVTAKELPKSKGVIHVLDPACGDGALLLAFARSVDEETRRRLVLIGYETNPKALKTARRAFEDVTVRDVVLFESDFLAVAEVLPSMGTGQRSLFQHGNEVVVPSVDVVIANPPYVRTQVLGAAQSRTLAKRFGLTGRVDLYHAFVKAMAGVLKDGGVLGLLTSNRFLTIKSGVAMRRLLRNAFAIKAVYDLGDTKLFSAAVLPVVLVAKKSGESDKVAGRFERIYEHRIKAPVCDDACEFGSILEALQDRETTGVVRTPTGTYRIERGSLYRKGLDEVWTLSTPEYDGWLNCVAANREFAFGDVAHIRVGIKTTCDEAFIRDDWSVISAEERPEAELIRPLIRHHDASRWTWSTRPRQMVLYPHISREGRRRAVDLKEYPRTEKYLASFKDKLTRRHYVIEGGRQWFEIWVPHQPDGWSAWKIVFPDIAEQPRFFLDTTGAIVNGDCYWMTLKPNVDPVWLYLLLAVANSTFITRYYDLTFHNKLYAGRRRFMAQFVKRFPLPRLHQPASKRIIRLVAKLIADPENLAELEVEIDDLVWQSFGLSKEVGW